MKGDLMTGEEFLALSDERDVWLRRVVAAWRAGRAAGHTAGYDAGYADGVEARKHAGQDALEAYRVLARRWELRGERRTGRTFGRPHRDDFPGRAAVKARSA
jgi:hypothetical protein